VFADFSAAARFVQPEARTMPNPENFECYDRIKPLFERCYRALEPIFDEF
jgi:Sugar (pentulose and hexulose) kinases